jgi:hypothetical protein
MLVCEFGKTDSELALEYNDFPCPQANLTCAWGRALKALKTKAAAEKRHELVYNCSAWALQSTSPSITAKKRPIAKIEHPVLTLTQVPLTCQIFT